jgi:phosphoribosylaminoimidazole carboxylase PurE protein
MLVVLFLGSPSDREFAQKITDGLDRFDIPWKLHIASAHKTPRHLIDLLDSYRAEPKIVYITVAGRSNALGGFVDAQVAAPVITCPPYSDRFSGSDVFSSLRMPSGVAPAVVLEPSAAALLAAKILGLTDSSLVDRINTLQDEQRQRLLDADADQR